MSATMKIEEPDLGYQPKGLYYGGRWVEATSGKTFQSINPSTGTKLGDVPYADAKDVDLAVQAAAKGFEEWSKVGIKERAKCLETWAKRVREQAKRLALIDAVDSGNAVKAWKVTCTGPRTPSNTLPA
jgi:acyl-CoA reductase-like NAD-dependent aldehyde dehydrogenase